VSQPDLFVVCKNCGSEVSPYVTECPYCGQRVRKRAPRIDKGPPARERRRTRFRPPSLPRLRHGEIPGIAPETTPWATIALIVGSLALTVVGATAVSLFDLGGLYFSPDEDWWRLLATPFVHGNAGYQFIALVAVGVFGTHLERRFGLLAPIAVFVLSGAAGALLADVASDLPALGANGAALGLLAAWYADDRVAHRRGDDRENDLLGVYVFVAVLLLIPLAEEDASYVAGLAGALTGALLGLVMTSLRRA
jgi:membrane associated rhomboid family serine protease